MLSRISTVGGRLHNTSVSLTIPLKSTRQGVFNYALTNLRWRPMIDIIRERERIWGISFDFLAGCIFGCSRFYWLSWCNKRIPLQIDFQMFSFLLHRTRREYYHNGLLRLELILRRKSAVDVWISRRKVHRSRDCTSIALTFPPSLSLSPNAVLITSTMRNTLASAKRFDWLTIELWGDDLSVRMIDCPLIFMQLSHLFFACFDDHIDLIGQITHFIK